MNDKTNTLTIRIPPAEKAALVEHCGGEDLTPSQVVRRLIRDFLKQQGKGQSCAPQP